jgi:hypothetical protein
MSSCLKEKQDPNYVYYISQRTERLDPVTGEIQISEHNGDDRIVIRIELRDRNIEVYNPLTGSSAYYYDYYLDKEVALCDSTYNVRKHYLSRNDQLYIIEYKKEVHYHEYFIKYVKLDNEAELDCNERIVFIKSKGYG